MYDITEYGAKGDGRTNDAAAIQRAIDACGQAGGGRVVVPGGSVFVSGSLILRSHVELYLESGSVLKASGSIEDFTCIDADPAKDVTVRTVPSYVNCEYDGRPRSYFIYAKDASFVTISGPGKIDGNEKLFYGEITRYHIEGSYYPRIPLLLLENVDHLTVSDVVMTGSGFWTLHMAGCSDVLVSRIRILNNLMMANCDGIDPDHCRNVRISDCHIECADDCIVLKNTRGYRDYGPCEHIIISGCTLVSTSAAIKIGTESEDDFRNIVIDNCCISSSNRGISLQLRDSGSIENVSVSNVTIETRRFSREWWGMAEPISISCLDRKPGVTVGHIRNVRFSGISCTSENGILIYGNAAAPVKDISFDRVSVHLRKISKWPVSGYDLRPCSGEGILAISPCPLFIRYADTVTVSGFTVRIDDSIKQSVRPENDIRNCQNVIGCNRGNSRVPESSC